MVDCKNSSNLLLTLLWDGLQEKETLIKKIKYNIVNKLFLTLNDLYLIFFLNLDCMQEVKGVLYGKHTDVF